MYDVHFEFSHVGCFTHRWLSDIQVVLFFSLYKIFDTYPGSTTIPSTKYTLLRPVSSSSGSGSQASRNSPKPYFPDPAAGASRLAANLTCSTSGLDRAGRELLRDHVSLGQVVVHVSDQQRRWVFGVRSGAVEPEAISAWKLDPGS